MRYFLLTSAALLLLGSEAAQAQYYPNHHRYPQFNRNGFAPYRYGRAPVIFSLSLVRPVVQPIYVPVVNSFPVAPIVQPQIGFPPVQQALPQIDPQQAAQLVTSWYNTFLRRQPDAAGLQNHIQVVATQGEDVALSGILGSDEYWQICGQDVRSWIASLYVNVLNRQPAEAEIQHWHQVFVSFGGDRQRMLLNFLPGARTELRR